MSHTFRAKRGFMTVFLLTVAAMFVALGVWQVERRAWKLGLIAAVDQRIQAPPGAAPGPSDWPAVSAQANAYAHVQVHGTLLNERETLVQALTELGPGFWVMTPLQVGGWTVLINRGFVPSERSTPASRRAGEPGGPVTITGLLRVTEPGGGFLTSNDPTGDHWYSRDVAGIAQARELGRTAPYFIDADATPNPGGYPVGGLTVVTYPNNHLVYSITWFVLAGLSVTGLWAMRTVDASNRKS